MIMKRIPLSSGDKKTSSIFRKVLLIVGFSSLAVHIRQFLKLSNINK